MNKNSSKIKSWKTRADTQRTKAQDIFRSYRGQKTKEAIEARKQARHLLELAKRNINKANQMKADKISELERAWIAIEEEDLDLDISVIDTVEAKLLNRWGTGYIKTPVAEAIMDWIESERAAHGDKAVATVLKKAKEKKPYIFDRYIYDSDQDGTETEDARSLLEDCANEYIEGRRERANNLANARNAAEDVGIDTSEFDTSIGNEGWY